MKLRIIFAITSFLALLLHPSYCMFAQISNLQSYELDLISESSPLPPSNSVSYISINAPVIYIGTSKGLAKSVNGGRSWESFRRESAFANDGIFAIATRGSSIWASTGYVKELDEGSVQTGSGYAFSMDDGLTWQHVDQTLDQRGDSILTYGINDSVWMLPIVVPEQNVTFDITITPSNTLWIASWASGLRKSTDNGQNWQRILLPLDNLNTLYPTDTLWSYRLDDSLHQHRVFQRFDPRHDNNLLVFAVHASNDDTIWCGTAGGINKSTDGGQSWMKFNHQNQASPILGNWVIAIDEQHFQNFQRIWSTNWRAEDMNEKFGVSYTDDGGRTWVNLLHGVRAYDFAFKDSITYIATDDGIYRTADGGLNFIKVSNMLDPSTHQYLPLPQVFAVEIIDDTVFIGTNDGIASTIDNDSHQFGSSWKIYRTFQPVGFMQSTYAYPNPFSPLIERVRIHYGLTSSLSSSTSSRNVSIDIFDFSMNRVRSLLTNAQRSATMENDEIWDGLTDDGRLVANGVYFYRININNEEPLFGKILVIQ